MPAFLAHFRILEMSANKSAGSFVDTYLGAGSGEFLYRPPHRSGSKLSQFAYFGSVGPDLPYFSEPDESKQAKLNWLADLFHWKRTGTMVTYLLDRARGLQKGGDAETAKFLLPFVFGYICHIAGDIMVHPYVNCFAGQYEHQYKNKIIDTAAVLWALTSLPFLDQEGKQHLNAHQFVELHQDVYLANKKYGAPKLSDGPADSVAKSWSDFFQDIKGTSQLRKVLQEVAVAVRITHGKPVAVSDLDAAEERMHDALDVGYDTGGIKGGMHNVPDYYVIDFVEHKYVERNYESFLGAAAWVAAEVFWPAAITYLSSKGEPEDRRRFIGVIGQFNLDTGYDIRVYGKASGHTIFVRYDHSWARFLSAKVKVKKTGSVCVGAATQSEWPSFAVDDKRPKLGGRYTAALVQKMNSNISAPMPELVKGLTVHDTFERQYTIEDGDNLRKIALKHHVSDTSQILDHPRNQAYKANRALITQGNKIWISNRVPFPTSAYMAGTFLTSSDKPAKYALICSNDKYTNSSETDLEHCKHDAEMLEQALTRRGFKILTKNNSLPKPLATALTDLLDKGVGGGPAPKVGDEICFFYSGHGEPEGLRCDRDGEAGILAIKTLTDMADKAYSKGLHLTLSFDSCYSGCIADAVRSRAIEFLAQKTGDAKLKAILQHTRSLQNIKKALAKAENQLTKLSMEASKPWHEVELARRKRNRALIRRAEARAMAAQEKYGKDYVATAATVRDTWFRQVPVIKKGIQNIKGQSGPELASRGRYGKIQDLMTAATSRQAFDAWWGNNNQFSDHRPQELDDLDDMVNAAIDHVRAGM